MPYLDASLREALGLAGSCPSEEDIAAAAAARGLQLRDGQLSTVQAKRQRRAAAAVQDQGQYQVQVTTQVPGELGGGALLHLFRPVFHLPPQGQRSRS